MLQVNELEETQPNWQSAFLKMLPEVQRRSARAFSFLGNESREDAVCEAVAHSLFAYVRLYERGCAERASAGTLALYAVRHVKRGRPAAGRINSKEPLSRYAQLGRGFRVDDEQSRWIDEIVTDKRAAVGDMVALKIDFRAWLVTLSKRMRRIVEDLAQGFSTSEVAKKYGLSVGRISQLRRVLAESWFMYQNQMVRSNY